MSISVDVQRLDVPGVRFRFPANRLSLRVEENNAAASIEANHKCGFPVFAGFRGARIVDSYYSFGIEPNLTARLIAEEHIFFPALVARQETVITGPVQRNQFDPRSHRSREAGCTFYLAVRANVMNSKVTDNREPVPPFNLKSSAHNLRNPPNRRALAEDFLCEHCIADENLRSQ